MKKKNYTIPSTIEVVLDAGEIMRAAGQASAFTPPGPSAPARSGAMRNTLIKA